jgi:hypothetical protein
MRNVDDNLKLLADEYGKLKAEMTRLTGRQKDIKSIFESAGVHELEGESFRCVGSDVPDSTGPDWEKLARKFASTKSIKHPSNQRVTKKAHYRVSVYGRTGVTL